jgi:pimeloyl-ACP methyl ester carboxylesterase/DNA-binding CsgD family transcriptional regulator
MAEIAEQLRFCTSRDGTRIAYGISGGGPPLVWAQYWNHHLKLDRDSAIWRPWLSMLARRHTLVRYDWRGCGLSDRHGVQFSFQALVDDMRAIIDAAGLERFALFGMSGGAAVAMDYAARHPERVCQLVLYGCQARGRLARSTTESERDEAETRLKMIAIGWPGNTPAFGRFFSSLQMPDADPEQLRSFDDLARSTTTATNLIGLLRVFFSYDMRDMLAHVRCPTLVLQPTHGAITPFDEGRMVASLVQGAQLVPLETRNHLLLDNEAAWPQLVAALEDFLPVSSHAAGTLPLEDLTPREREVLELVSRGQANQTVAAGLGISEKTVRNHVSIILGKLGVNSRAQAVALARDAGFGRRARHSG